MSAALDTMSAVLNVIQSAAKLFSGETDLSDVDSSDLSNLTSLLSQS